MVKEGNINLYMKVQDVLIFVEYYYLKEIILMGKKKEKEKFMIGNLEGVYLKKLMKRMIIKLEMEIISVKWL